MNLGGDPDVVGRILNIDGSPHTVVGVMPAGFRIWTDADLWRPMRLGEAFAGARRYTNYIMIGRLGLGRSIEQAQSQVDVIAATLATEYPEANRNKDLLLTELQESLTESYRTSLLVLLGAVGFILWIACAAILLRSWRSEAPPGIQSFPFGPHWALPGDGS